MEGHLLWVHRFYRADYGKLYYPEGFEPFVTKDSTEAGTLLVQAPGERNSLVGDLNILHETFGRRSMHLSNLSLLLLLSLLDVHGEKFVKELLYSEGVAESPVLNDYTLEALVKQLGFNEGFQAEE